MTNLFQKYGFKKGPALKRNRDGKNVNKLRYWIFNSFTKNNIKNIIVSILKILNYLNLQ